MTGTAGRTHRLAGRPDEGLMADSPDPEALA
jgi:hypothetical protein